MGEKLERRRNVKVVNAIKLAETFLHRFFRAACLRSCARTTCTHHVKHRWPPPQFSGWTDCELVLDHRTVRLMAAAFLPQFGCFARSQINALDRHERLCCASRFCHLRVFVRASLRFWIGKSSYGGARVEHEWMVGRGKKKEKDSRVVWDGYEIMFYGRWWRLNVVNGIL